MKNLTLLFFVLISFVSQSQTKKIDSTEICFPYQVGKQILLDLNECDKTVELLKSTEKEVILLNKKVSSKDTIINLQKKQLEIDSVIIGKTNEKFEIVNQENTNLRKDIKTIKTKRTIIESALGLFSAVLIYLIATK
jgi:hypothetical protein